MGGYATTAVGHHVSTPADSLTGGRYTVTLGVCSYPVRGMFVGLGGLDGAQQEIPIRVSAGHGDESARRPVLLIVVIERGAALDAVPDTLPDAPRRSTHHVLHHLNGVQQHALAQYVLPEGKKLGALLLAVAVWLREAKGAGHLI